MALSSKSQSHQAPCFLENTAKYCKFRYKGQLDAFLRLFLRGEAANYLVRTSGQKRLATKDHFQLVEYGCVASPHWQWPTHFLVSTFTFCSRLYR